MGAWNRSERAEEEKIVLDRFVLGLFLLSGMAGLMYEILWVRQFANVFGASAYAVTIVLTTFMFGLGLGSWLVGRLADRLDQQRLARTYVFLEIGVGAYSLMLPFLLDRAKAISVHFYQTAAPDLFVYNSFKLLLSFLLLALPTVFIGATLPIICRYIGQKRGGFGLTVSKLYAVNTLGAIVGTVLTGYILLPHWGIRLTNILAVGINFLVALGFWLVSSENNTPSGADQEDSFGSEAVFFGRNTSLHNLVILGFFLSGAAAMFYEVAWTRTLCMILGTTTYAFTTMLATFLLGIALGSAFYRLIPKDISRLKLFVGLQLVIAFSAFFTVFIFDKLPFVYLSLHIRWVHSWINFQVLRFFIAALVMIIPTLAMGTLFPVVSAIIVEESSQAGRKLGRAFAWNTFGATLGAAAAGLILIPVVGMQKTIMGGAILNFAAALGVILFRTEFPAKQRLTVSFAICCIAGMVFWLAAPWAPKVLNSGAYIYASRYQNLLDRYRKLSIEQTDVPEMFPWKIWKLAMNQYKLLYYNTGVTATVAVMERNDGVRFLTIDGKTDASTGMKSDMRTQVMIGQLPLLFHEDPDKVLVVGLGSGVTVGSVLTHKVRVVDCAEISPSVVEAATFFSEANHHALQDPRLRIVPQDARNMLMTRDGSYDVIVSQPSNPWISGESSLFSMEWYSLIHDHLEEDGLFLQWLPSYLMNDRDLKVIVHTLRSVFPNLTLWSSGSIGDLILIASKGGRLEIDYRSFQKQIQQKKVREDIERIGLDPLLLPFRLFVMNNRDLSAYLYAQSKQPLKKNTDDLLITEFSTPKRLITGKKIKRFVDTEFLQGNIESLMEMLRNVDEAALIRLLNEKSGATGLDSAKTDRGVNALYGSPI